MNPDPSDSPDVKPDDPSGQEKDSTFGGELTAELKECYSQCSSEVEDAFLQLAVSLAGASPIQQEHLQRACELMMSQAAPSDWSVANRRRIYLIRKQRDTPLSTEERTELAQLQADADERISRVAPRPLEELWELRDRLKLMPPDEAVD